MISKWFNSQPNNTLNSQQHNQFNFPAHDCSYLLTSDVFDNRSYNWRPSLQNMQQQTEAY